MIKNMMMTKGNIDIEGQYGKSFSKSQELCLVIISALRKRQLAMLQRCFYEGFCSQWSTKLLITTTIMLNF